MSQRQITELAALTSALVGAARTGLLRELFQGPATAADLAGRLALDTEALAVVLEVLRAHEAIVADGRTYRLSDWMQSELEGPIGAAGEPWVFWARVTDFLRGGPKAIDALTTGAEGRGHTYANVAPRLAPMFTGPAHELAHRLGALCPALALGAPFEILDVGAGSGVWSLAVLRRYPGARSTGLDLGRVLPRFEEAAKAQGLGDRIRALEGDYHDLPPGHDRWDLVIAANVLHLEPREHAAELVARLCRCVREGGALVVVDALSDGTAAQERVRASYALGLALRLPGATPHREADLCRWIADAGLSGFTRVPLARGVPGLAALVAHSPSTGRQP
jgi:3-hydroxy-5-methyl-1-naphthoate 3-O-methyltransferase